MKWNRLMAGIGAVTIGLFLVVILTPAVNVASRLLADQPDIRQSDAIVVLASGLMNDGTLNAESMERFIYGLGLYKQGLAPLLILSGPPRDRTEPESTVRAKLAVQFGVPASAILELPHVLTTRDEALDTAVLMKQRNIRNVLLVTEPLHMRRARRIFEAVGLSVAPAPSNRFPETAASPEDRLLLLQTLLTQGAGLAYYHLAGFI